MKKHLIFTLLIFTFFQGYSQRLNYGIGLWLTSSSFILKNIPGEDPNYKFGIQANAILKYNYTDKIAIRFEPGLANRGTKLSYVGSSDTKVNLSYLLFPVVLHYSLFDKFSILLGPEYALRLSAKGKTDHNTVDLKTIYDSKGDFGIIAGLSYNLFEKFEVGLRYNRGFISTIKDLRFTDENGNDLGKASAFNQGFTFSIAFLIK